MREHGASPRVKLLHLLIYIGYIGPRSNTLVQLKYKLSRRKQYLLGLYQNRPALGSKLEHASFTIDMVSLTSESAANCG